MKKGVCKFGKKSMVDKKNDSNNHIWNRLGSLVPFRYCGLAIDTLKDFISIYTWRETWMVAGAGGLVVAVWLYLCLAISLPNPIRAIMMWGLLVSLFCLVAHYNPKGIR